ncbi:hypothetical protein LZ554_000864 [Drepanopeziza brunnea f. sp. 'monogermtubi']|nr:hypothetical protein LZ554_000864 [Drepanopeziza brunnea f. sp. 'monogermtubi']
MVGTSRVGIEVSPSPPELSIADEFSSKNLRVKNVGSTVTKGPKKGPPLVLPQTSKFTTYTDDWAPSGSTSTDNLPMRTDSKASNGSTTTLATIHELYSSSSSTRTSTSSTPRPTRPPTCRTRSCSSTILIHASSSRAPISIILTTPEGDDPSFHIPPPTPYPSIHARASLRSYPTPSLLQNTRSRSSAPHPNFSVAFLPTIPDTTRLMPPTEHAIDTHRLRRTQEAREIRRFIISFLNTKGDTFPRKLRVRIMDGYAIHEKELNPDVVQRFHESDLAAVRDEGVALDAGGKQQDDRENLRILELAFKSQIPHVTPALERSCTDGASGPWKSGGRRVRVAGRKLEDREERAGALLAGTSISTADLTPARFRDAQHQLHASVSVPPGVQQRRRPSSFYSETKLKDERERTARKRAGAGGSSVGSSSRRRRSSEWDLLPTRKQLPIAAAQQTRIKRQSIIPGAVGAVRKAVSGSSLRSEEDVERRADDAGGLMNSG